MPTKPTKSDIHERKEFSKRWKASLASAGMIISPTVLQRVFNSQSSIPVSVHAARKWLMRDSIPTQSHLRTLSEIFRDFSHLVEILRWFARFQRKSHYAKRRDVADWFPLPYQKYTDAHIEFDQITGRRRKEAKIDYCLFFTKLSFSLSERFSIKNSTQSSVTTIQTYTVGSELSEVIFFLNRSVWIGSMRSGLRIS